MVLGRRIRTKVVVPGRGTGCSGTMQVGEPSIVTR